MKIRLAIIIILLGTTLNSIKPNRRLIISSIKIHPNILQNRNSSVFKFNAVIEIKNTSDNIIFFWTMSRSCSLNFVTNKDEVDFVSFSKSDNPKINILLPYMILRCKEKIYVNKIINQYFLDDLSIGFKLYEANKFKREDFLNSILPSLHLDRSSYKSYNIIWYHKPLSFENTGVNALR